MPYVTTYLIYLLSFPPRRSSNLAQRADEDELAPGERSRKDHHGSRRCSRRRRCDHPRRWTGCKSGVCPPLGRRVQPDRKSTRLNSSHRCISYVVLCLKITIFISM